MILFKRQQISLTRWVMLGLFLLGSILPSVSLAGYVDLSSWLQQGPLENANWVVADDNKLVQQIINGGPSFFVSPNNFINGTVRGSFGVYSSDDDDWMGFVFGYKSPIAGQDNAVDNTYLLFDWKQGINSETDIANEGFSLIRIQNLPSWTDTSGDPNCFWAHEHNPPGCEILATDYGSGKGWQHYTKYWFELNYRTDRIVIKVGESPDRLRTIFDISGKFEPGRFGFYNLSQNFVRYNEFVVIEGESPTANDDNYHLTNRNSLKKVAAEGILANDSSSTLDNFVAVLEDSPKYGELFLRLDGSFTYIPDKLHCADSFTYRAFDGVEYTDIATVNITINNAADLMTSQLQLKECNKINEFVVIEGESPTANDDNYHFNNRNSLKKVAAEGVLANDSSSTLDNFVAVLEDSPKYGELFLRLDGSFTYIPDKLHCTDSFTYRAFDGVEYTDIATVNITINNAADLMTSQLQYNPKNASLTVRVDNIGIVASPESPVNFYGFKLLTGGMLIGSATVASLKPGESAKVVLENVPDLSATENMYAVVDPERKLKECNKINNLIAIDPEAMLSTPASCQLYAVNDEGPNNSQLFTITIQKGVTENKVTEFGAMYAGYDIEAIAIDPKTNIIYAASGHNTKLGLPKGHLYFVDTQTNVLFPIGSTGFEEVDSLAFSRDGTLWGWAKKVGLITINPQTGAGVVELPSTVRLEDLTLGKQETGTVFYGAAGNELWIYTQDTNTLEVACTNLPGEVESLGLLSSNLLLLGSHKNKGLHFFDIHACELIGGAKISTTAFDDIEGQIMPLEKCSIWNNLLKGFEKVLPPKIPSELLSDLPALNLKKLLHDMIRRIINEYVDDVSDTALREFLYDLPAELPPEYPSEFIEDILEELPVEVQDKIDAELTKGYLLEHTTAHLTNIHKDLLNPVLPLLPSKIIRRTIGDLVHTEMDELIDELVGEVPNFLVSEFFSYMPGYLLDELMENYGKL